MHVSSALELFQNSQDVGRSRAYIFVRIRLPFETLFFLDFVLCKEKKDFRYRAKSIVIHGPHSDCFICENNFEFEVEIEIKRNITQNLHHAQN